MTERDWGPAARGRLERSVAVVVARLRAAADQIEREARHNIESASPADRRDYASYAGVAQSVVHEVNYAVVNAHLENVIDAASDAEAAREEKKVRPVAGAHTAIAAMLDVARGWARTAAENDEAMDRHDLKDADHQPFFLADIIAMVDDAAREVGVVVELEGKS